MNLGVFNCDRRLIEWLTSYDIMNLDNGEEYPNIDALIIDWLPRNISSKEKLARQAALVDFYANKKKTIVLFDRYLDVNEREFKYLKKFNTFFFEPAIKHRDGFDFLPPWTRCYDLVELPTYGENGERGIDLGYIGSLKNRINSFEKYYVEFASLYPKFKVNYSASLPKSKIDEYKDAGVTKKDFAFKEMKCFLLIDSPRNYEIGYLNPDIFDMMYLGCFPLLPKEHRFYHSVFSVVDEIKYISIYIEIWDKVREIVLLDIYDNIKAIFPEMDIANTVEILKKCIEK